MSKRDWVRQSSKGLANRAANYGGSKQYGSDSRNSSLEDDSCWLVVKSMSVVGITQLCLNDPPLLKMITNLKTVLISFYLQRTHSYFPSPTYHIKHFQPKSFSSILGEFSDREEGVKYMSAKSTSELIVSFSLKLSILTGSCQG